MKPMHPAYISRLLLVVATLGLVLNNDVQAQEDDEAKRLSIRYAASQTMKEALKDLEGREPTGLSEQYANVILTNISAHAATSQSRTLLSGQYQQYLQELLEHDVQRIHRSFNPAETPDKWFSTDWLDQYLEQELAPNVKSALDQNHRRYFEAIFSGARSRAAEQQLRQLSLSVFPSIEEIDELYRAAWSSARWQQLTAALVQRIAGNQIALEENHPRINKHATDILRDARAQHEGQMEVLALGVDQSLITAAQIAEGLRRNVQGVIAGLRQEQSEFKVYEIFPGVEQQLGEEARAIESERFIRFIASYPFQVTQNEIKRLIEPNTAQHQAKDQSLRLVRQHFFSDAPQQVTRAYASRANTSGEAADFGRHLQQLISGGQAKTSLENRLFQVLAAPHSTARDEIANEQVNQHFPQVENGSWIVPEDVLTRHSRAEYPGVANFDDAANLRTIREGGRSFNKRDLLVETQDLMTLRAQQLLQEGLNALNEQKALVDRKVNDIGDEIEREPDKMSVDAWIEYFTNKLQEEWHLVGPQRTRSNKYQKLFGETKLDIEMVVKNQFSVAQAEHHRQQELVEQQQQVDQQQQQVDQQGQQDESAEEEQQNPGQGTDGTSGEGASMDKEVGGGADDVPKGEGDLLSLLLWLLLLFLGIILTYLLIRYLLRHIFRFTVRVSDLDEAQRSLDNLLGMKPTEVSSARLVYSLGNLQKMIVKPKRGSTSTA